MKKKKTLDVAKFGGIDELGKVELHGHEHDAASIEAQSKAHLEDDRGEGNAAIIRCFTFGINPEAFQRGKPTKQDLFNAHIKGIEIMLWRDGMTPMTEVEPRILLDSKNMTYKIFVGAKPMRGHLLQEKPKTLTEVAHGI
jgi:hypothetical protein